MWRLVLLNSDIEGELERFFLSVQIFYRPQTKRNFKKQFSLKSPKVGKNQAKGCKIHNSNGIRPTVGIHQFCPPTYYGNPPILSSELLWESTFYKFGHQPTVGIHQFWSPSCCGNPLFTKSANNLLWESIYSVL